MVAVVMGGSSAGSRDARMRELISQTITTASTKRTAPMVAERSDKSEPKVAAKIEAKSEAKTEAKVEAKVAKIEPKAEAKVEAKVAAESRRHDRTQVRHPRSDGKDQQRFAVASATSTPVRLAGPPTARMAPGSSEPIRPVLVRTVSVKPGTLQTGRADAVSRVRASPRPRAIRSQRPSPAPAKPETPKVEAAKAVEIAKVAETPKDRNRRRSKPPSRSGRRRAADSRARRRPRRRAESPRRLRPPAATRATAAVPPPVKSVVRSGWMIQVGAFTAEQEAKQRLSAIQSKASKVVDGTDPFTESVEKGGSTFYRARFRRASTRTRPKPPARCSSVTASSA